VLAKPLLYLSLFFKRHRDDYYRRLSAVRVDGDWEGWTDFFLAGVATIADEGVASARDLFALVTADRRACCETMPPRPPPFVSSSCSLAIPW
jgi:Fic family protein